MKKIFENLNIHNINKIIQLFYYLLLLIIIYFSFLICKQWHIFNFITTIIKILSPLFIGISMAYILNPVINLLEKKINRKLSVLIIYILIFSLIILSSIYIYPKIIKELYEFINNIPDFINYFEKFVKKIFKNNITINNYINNYFKKNILNKTIDIFLLVKNILKFLGILILGLIISFYLSLNFNKNIQSIYYKIPIKNKYKYKNLIKEINEKLYSYIKGTFLIALIVFLSSFIAFKIIHLNQALFLALYNSLSNIIPYIGPYIGALPILIIAFSINNKIGIITIIILIIIQAIESYILQPYIMSKSMELHPVTIMLSLIIFGYFFGIIGMILAMPVISIIKIITLHFYTHLQTQNIDKKLINK